MGLLLRILHMGELLVQCLLQRECFSTKLGDLVRSELCERLIGARLRSQALKLRVKRHWTNHPVSRFPDLCETVIEDDARRRGQLLPVCFLQGCCAAHATLALVLVQSVPNFLS